jgi:7-cyano-7-deazaguanine synthase
MMETKSTSRAKPEPEPQGALVILSGGADSATCLALAAYKWGAERVHAITFRYGQKHQSKENSAAEQLAMYYGIDGHLYSHNLETGRGGLTDHGSDIPNVDYKDIKGVSPTYVPFRNGLMISQAVSFAVGLNLAEVWFGAHADDASGDAYPDCTLEFVGAMAAAVHRGTYGRTRLVAPLLNMEKWEIILQGAELDVPYNLTWSCYRGEDEHCGTCPTCRARKQAFHEAGVTDPTKYAA